MSGGGLEKEEDSRSKSKGDRQKRQGVNKRSCGGKKVTERI